MVNLSNRKYRYKYGYKYLSLSDLQKPLLQRRRSSIRVRLSTNGQQSRAQHQSRELAFVVRVKAHKNTCVLFELHDSHSHAESSCTSTRQPKRSRTMSLSVTLRPARGGTPVTSGRGGGCGAEELSSTNIYIRGLQPTTTDADLFKLCSWCARESPRAPPHAQCTAHLHL